MGPLEKLRQLIALTQLHLLQTRAKGEWVVVSKSVPQPKKVNKAEKTMGEKRALPAVRVAASVEESLPVETVRKVETAPRFDDLRRMLQTHCPEIALVDGERSEVVIMCQAHHPQEEKFWRHLAAAIHLSFNRRVQISYLRQAKEEVEGKGYLLLIEEGAAPMLPGAIALNAAAAYLKQPAEKAKLWQKLTSALSSSHV